MSLFSQFLRNHLIPSLESAFLAHIPEMQDALIQEVEVLGNKLLDWVDSKIKNNPTDGD